MEETRIRIVVLDRGFVLVGRCPDPEGYALWLPILDARIIRRWGTTNGLSELVSGPRSGTTLDAPAAEKVPVRAVLRVIEVQQEPWERVLTPAPATSRGGRRAATT